MTLSHFQLASFERPVSGRIAIVRGLTKEAADIYGSTITFTPL
jgi:hypothetical protein